jgi:hypothetical protein
MQGSGVHCPDYTRDLTIREKISETVELKEPENKKGKKKSSDIRIL